MPSGPFYTVNDSLQEILTRQKLEARQAMLDEIARKDMEQKWKQTEIENTRNQQRDDLNRRQVEASITNTTENTDSLREQRKLTGEGKVLDQIGGMFAPGETLPFDLDPEVSGVLDKYGRTKKTFTPSIDGETESTQDVNKIYRGSPEDLIKDRNRKAIEEYLKNPNIPDEVRRALQFQSAVPGVSMPAGMFGKTETSDKQNYDTAVGQGYKGSFVQFMREKANFNSDAPPSHQPFVGVGPDGKPLMLGYNPKTNSAVPMQLPVNAPQSQPMERPGTISSSSSNSSISAAEVNAMRAALAQQARAAQGIAGTDRGLADRGLYTTQNQIIDKHLPEDLRDGVRQILAMPPEQRKQFTRDQLVSKFSPVGPDGKPLKDASGNRIPLPPDKQAILQTVLGHILGY